MKILHFEEFEMDLQGRSLKKSGEYIRIGSRAFDLLCALASRAGEVLSKVELTAAAWPETHVEESSLRVNIVALRKALDDDRSRRLIENVAGRGYTFTAPVRRSDSWRSQTPSPAVQQVDFVPVGLSRLIGRDQLIDHWASEIGQGITTIVGQGGIGKTSVAIQIAGDVQSAFEEVHFLDVADGSQVNTSPLAIALRGDDAAAADAFQSAVNSFSGKAVLIILDGCEVSIDRCAQVVEAMADRNPKIVILATSREPLGIMGERVRHLHGLTIPSPNQSVADISAFTGMELFADRLSNVAEDCGIDTPHGMALAAEIVRKTDGNPLAIELAASRVTDLGLENLIASLDRPLRTLRRGSRTSHPRQRTLRANIDWSYDLLNEDEKSLLAHLSVFEDNFTREDAWNMIGPHLEIGGFETSFDRLVVKSLIVRDPTLGTHVLPRLIGEYAREKLNSFETVERDLDIMDTVAILREPKCQRMFNSRPNSIKATPLSSRVIGTRAA